MKPQAQAPLYYDMGAMVDDANMDDDDVTSSSAEYTINVGISLEPLASVEGQLDQSKALMRMSGSGGSNSSTSKAKAPEDPESIAVLANKIVQHAYNFLSSFTDAQGKVPMRAFDDWWAKFKSRLASDPKFLDAL